MVKLDILGLFEREHLLLLSQTYRHEIACQESVYYVEDVFSLYCTGERNVHWFQDKLMFPRELQTLKFILAVYQILNTVKAKI